MSVGQRKNLSPGKVNSVKEIVFLDPPYGSLDMCPESGNRSHSYSRYWTGTTLEWRLMRGNITKKRLMTFTFEKTPHISLSCKLDPGQYRECECMIYFLSVRNL